MKRSTHLQLTIMAAALPAALSGCDSQPTGVVMASVDQCRTTQDVGLEDCRRAYAEALGRHQQLAPRFENAADCKAQFGDCDQVDEHGGARWIPPMAGFLVGLGVARDPKKEHAAYAATGASPLYRDQRTGEYLNASGEAVAKGPGHVTGAKGSTAVPEKAATVSRTGFGESAGEHGGFGAHGGTGE